MMHSEGEFGDAYQDSARVAWKMELTIQHQGGVICIFRLKLAEETMTAGKLAQKV